MIYHPIFFITQIKYFFITIKCWPVVEQLFEEFINYYYTGFKDYFPDKKDSKTRKQIHYFIESRKVRAEWFVKLDIEKRKKEKYGLFNTLDEDIQLIERIGNSMFDYGPKDNDGKIEAYNKVSNLVGAIRAYNKGLQFLPAIKKDLFFISSFSNDLEQHRDKIIRSGKKFCEDMLLKDTAYKIDKKTVDKLLKPDSNSRDYWPYVSQLIKFIRDRFAHKNIEAILKDMDEQVLNDLGFSKKPCQDLFSKNLMNYINMAFPGLVPALYDVKKEYPESDFGLEKKKFKGKAWKNVISPETKLSKKSVKMFVRNSYLGKSEDLKEKKEEIDEVVNIILKNAK